MKDAVANNHKRNILLICLTILYIAIILFIFLEWFFTDSIINKLYLDAPILISDFSSTAQSLRPYYYDTVSYSLNLWYIVLSAIVFVIFGFVTTALFNNFSDNRRFLILDMMIISGMIVCSLPELIHWMHNIEPKLVCILINFIGFILGMLVGLVLKKYLSFRNFNGDNINNVVQ